MSFVFHPVDDDQMVEMFLYSLTQLKTLDCGLAPAKTAERERAGQCHGGNELEDLNAISLLCGVVKGITSACRDVEDVLLADVVEKTEALLVTAVIPAEDDLVKPWLKSRAELLSCRLRAL